MIGSKIDMMVGEKLIMDFFIRINYFCSMGIEQKLCHLVIYVNLAQIFTYCFTTVEQYVIILVYLSHYGIT
jgi:hypothetical protein